jgi:hypothetical protein
VQEEEPEHAGKSGVENNLRKHFKSIHEKMLYVSGYELQEAKWTVKRTTYTEMKIIIKILLTKTE